MQIADFTEVNDLTFGDWQRDYLYKVVIVKEPTAPLYATLKGGLDVTKLDAYLDSFPIPNSAQTPQKRRWAGQWFMFHGKLSSTNTIQITCRYDESNLLYQFLEAWHQCSGSDATAASASKAEYRGELAILTYKTDKETPSGGYLFKGAWVAELSDLDLAKSKDGLVTFTATIAYDKRTPYTA